MKNSPQSLTKTTFLSKYSDQAKLNQLTNKVRENIDGIYDYFGERPRYNGSDKVILSPCFIHGGDNEGALNLYHNADYRIHYKCRTHLCEEHFGSSLLSMVRGGLSHMKYDWQAAGDQTLTFDQTVDWLLEKLDLNFYTLKDAETVDLSNSEFLRTINAVTEQERPKGTIEESLYRSKAEIPSPYHLGRGYSKEVLERYGVGLCSTKGRLMYDRSMVPIYDDGGDYILGFSGRSIHGKCEECNHYHSPSNDCHVFPKWRHTKDLKTHKLLYNYWNAQQYIQESGVIILVESPGNVWRLEEAGVKNSVAIFGTSLGSDQQRLIDESGALSVILIMDQDNNQAGQRAAEVIKRKLEKLYRVYIVDINKNDIGEMSTNEVTEDIKPWIEQAREVYAL